MNYLTFSHEAMATTFQIMIAPGPIEYAGQAAAAAFRELDQLEFQLSRFIETSDIARANRATEGECIMISEDALQCLLAANRLSELTGRTFDPTYLTPRGDDVLHDQPLYELDPVRHTLTSHVPRLILDLGAAGKGYALDRMAEVLREWDLTAACLQSGNSTALALEPPSDEAGWPINAGDSVYLLAHSAVSGSGLTVQGEHIADPRLGRPPERSQRVWSFAQTGVEADALSTAFFVMSDEEVAAFSREHPNWGAILTQPDGQFASYGTVPSRLATP